MKTIVNNNGLFFLNSFFAVILIFSSPETLYAAGHDTYAGDTAIYGTSTANIQPNVLLIIDSSNSMLDTIVTGDPYNPLTTYPIANACEGSNQPCNTYEVYRFVAHGVEGMWVSYIDDVSSVSCTVASNILTTNGQYQGLLKQDGTCNTNSPRSYALGNYVNWLNQSSGSPQPKIDVAKSVVKSAINATSGVKIGAMIFNNQNGGIFIDYNGYQATIKDMDAIFSGSTTNREALNDGVDNITADDATPLAETLFDAMTYYSGGSSPIAYACQKNYVIIVTDGMSTQDQNAELQSICNSGDCDGDGFEPTNDPGKTYGLNGSDYLDDVAHYLYNNDLISDAIHAGKQNVITYTVGFGLSGADQSAIDLLQETADNGGGAYYTASDYTGLIESMREILSIILEDNTSFVAPVVPVSPENKTYSGSRIYFGFFKPTGDAFWYGNLKKYGIDTSGNVIDKYDAYATYIDNDGNGLDDRDGVSLPPDISNGDFRELSKSYWSTITDGGEVDIGGVGDVLFNRSTARNIYTYTGTSTDLTDSTNAFTTSNSVITATGTYGLNVANDTAKDKLINFVHGKDAYDADSDSDTTENRPWLLADILHSKLSIVNYSTYSFTPTNEDDCNVNKTIIFVGTNGGMLHAFSDCDGEELWSFIPQDLLDELQYLNSSTHSYYVDSSPTVYVYDDDKDGNIETADGDTVIVMFGERRGGGFYYALDVSDFNNPVYMWRLSDSESPSGTNTDYSELGQTWSEPSLGKIKDGTDDKIVAFIGAGYDKVNEDSRTGQEQTPVDAEGRGLYVVEVATLNGSGVPSFTNSGHKVWGYTYADNSNMEFSIPSAVSSVDTDFDDYVDRLYVGDTGGNLWAFDIGDASTSNWVVREIFSSNPGSVGASDTGRKIFYKPSVTLEVGYRMILFGTGDRAHPTEVNVVDRLYAVKDKDQTSVKTESSNLVDVTADTLQGSSTPFGTIQTILSDLNSLYGWYIKLENSGEKVLAPALTFFRIAYYTTYAPNIGSASCDSGNRGIARLYAVNYKTGEAVYNYDTTNDSLPVTNTRTMSDGDVLQGSDRVRILGTGIPSGIVASITTSGVTAFVGCGGALCQPPISSEGSTIMLYWREVKS